MASVDVAIPSYQYGRYLGQCLTSVLSQNVDTLRVLVIDNASTDNSVAVAREFAAKDPRVEVRAREKNLGPHASFNEAVDWARSDYFMLLCADDYLSPGSLARSVAVMEANPTVSFAFGTYIRYTEGEPFPALDDNTEAPWQIWEGRDFIRRCCSRMVLTVSPLMRTSILHRAGHFRPELYYLDDLEMLLRLAHLGPVAETVVPQAVQRLHQANISTSTWADLYRRYQEEVAMYESFFTNDAHDMPGVEKMRRFARHNVGKQVYWSGVASIAKGRGKDGLQLLKYAFKLCPSSAVIPPVDYLFQMEKPLDRAARLLSTALGVRRET